MPYCSNCGSPLANGSKYCQYCGAPAAASSVRPSMHTTQATQPAQPVRQQAVAAAPAEPKKHHPIRRLIAVFLVLALLFTGFIRPGFIYKLWPENEPENETAASGAHSGSTHAPSSTLPTGSGPTHVEYQLDARELSTEIPLMPDGLGKSKEIAASPLEGFFVSAPADTFAKDTDIKITKLESFDEPTRAAAVELFDEGYCVIDAYDVDAGLEDDEILMGEYTVTMDMEKLGIDPSLYPAVKVFRIGEDGSYYECASEVEDGKITYRADQNCPIFWAIFIPIVIAIAAGLYVHEGNAPRQYFYDTHKKMFSFTKNNGCFTYKILWAAKDIGVDDEALTKRAEELSTRYAQRADEICKKYKEDLMYEQSSIFGIFATGKSAAEVLKEAVEKDPEYQSIQQQLQEPEVVKLAAYYVDEAAKFLKNHEYLRMPTHVVEIVSKPGKSGKLAEATSRKAHGGFIEMNLSGLATADQTTKDNALLTLTHELFHICQEKYRGRLFWTLDVWDTIKYDEMAAVWQEPRALDYYQLQGIIDWDSHPELSSVNYWSTLKLPLDTYLYTLTSEVEGEIMKNEGYNLAAFVKYLEEKTGVFVYSDKLMRARSAYTKTNTAGPLMSVFGISEAELDVHYRNFMRKYKRETGAHYNAGKSLFESYKRNEEILIAKGGKYHVDVVPEGDYSSEIRAFRQTSKDPMILLLVPDSGTSTNLPGCNLVPVDDYKVFNHGAFIPAVSEKTLTDSVRNRDILEIHGAQGKSSGRGGYTIYVLDKTGYPQLSENEEDLIVTLPEPSEPAAAKVIAGYQMLVKADNGISFELDITPEEFDDEIHVPKTSLYGEKGDLEEELGVEVTLCEYVKAGESKLFGEISDVSGFVMGTGLSYDLDIFTAAWIPVQYDLEKIDRNRDWILGLAYDEEANTFGEFEGPPAYITATGRWVVIKIFEYDPTTRTLTIDFDENNVNATGVATFRILPNDHMVMTNAGGSFEFYRAPAE